MDITIRNAQVQDIPALLEMNEALNETGCSTFEHMKASLENNRNEIVLVALHNDTAVGFICGQLHFSICYANGVLCEVSELFVRESHRRMGVAGKLIAGLEDAFEKYGALEIFLQTGRRNIGAQAFYENKDYAVRERMVYLKKKTE